MALGESFTKLVFIFGFKYRKNCSHKCELLNFIIGQSKMVIYISRKRKVECNLVVDLKVYLARSLRSRILIDYRFYREVKDVESFSRRRCYGAALCEVEEGELVFRGGLAQRTDYYV